MLLGLASNKLSYLFAIKEYLFKFKKPLIKTLLGLIKGD